MMVVVMLRCLPATLTGSDAVRQLRMNGLTCLERFGTGNITTKCPARRMRAWLSGTSSRPDPPCCNTAVQVKSDVIARSAYELTEPMSYTLHKLRKRKSLMLNHWPLRTGQDAPALLRNNPPKHITGCPNAQASFL